MMISKVQTLYKEIDFNLEKISKSPSKKKTGSVVCNYNRYWYIHIILSVKKKEEENYLSNSIIQLL